MSDEPTADQTAEVLYKMRERFECHGIDGSSALREYVRQVVEDGSQFPEDDLTVSRPLTVTERITGSQEVSVGRWVSMGIMLGAALERDVPMDSEREEQWRDGEFELPDGGDGA
jgi:hypothetical protein